MTDLHEQVRDYYRRAAQAGPERPHAALDDERWGTFRYDAEAVQAVPSSASELSMGCGNPYALADLAEGEVVLDLGSGAGMDVILSAKRVGPSGRAYGVDFLEEMREIAAKNAAEAGVDNVEFLAGEIEAVPLPDDSVDVVISNCVISLAPDKRPVFSEMARVLRRGGRVAVSDVVADEDAPLAEIDSAEWAECGAGALRDAEYAAMLESAGFVHVTVERTHQVGDGLHAASVRAILP